jgi:hypothetical protein
MTRDWCKILKDAEGMGWYHCNSGGGVGPGNRSSRERSSTFQYRFGGNWAAEEMDSIYIQPGFPHSHVVVTLFSSRLLQNVDHLCHDEQLLLSNRGFFAATLEVWTIIHKAQALECERSLTMPSWPSEEPPLLLTLYMAGQRFFCWFYIAAAAGTNVCLWFQVHSIRQKLQTAAENGSGIRPGIATSNRRELMRMDEHPLPKSNHTADNGFVTDESGRQALIMKWVSLLSIC